MASGDTLALFFDRTRGLRPSPSDGSHRQTRIMSTAASDFRTAASVLLAGTLSLANHDEHSVYNCLFHTMDYEDKRR